MVLDLKLSRIENVPWGFRLAGGADYDIPLTVTKVIDFFRAVLVFSDNLTSSQMNPS